VAIQWEKNPSNESFLGFLPNTYFKDKVKFISPPIITMEAWRIPDSLKAS
jgi:hypothetical protein